MNKKMIIGIIVVVICIGCLGVFLLFNHNANEIIDNSSKENEDNNLTSTNLGKVLVVYYSATNNTKNVAEQITKNLNGDIFEIIPASVYTSEDLDWTDNKSRVSKEHDDENLRNVKLKNTNVDNWDKYDTILIGYPIWWGIAAWPVDTFVQANNFEGKTVIPFCTSVSSGLGESGKLLEKKANGGKWLDGYRFSSSATKSDIKKFTDSIK